MLNTRRVCVQFNMTALPPWVTARQLNSHTQVTSQQCGHRHTATWHLLGDMLDHPVTRPCDRKWTMAKRKTPMGLFATSNTVIKHLPPDWSIYFVGATQDRALCRKRCGNDRARHFRKWYMTAVMWWMWFPNPGHTVALTIQIHSHLYYHSISKSLKPTCSPPCLGHIHTHTHTTCHMHALYCFAVV